MIKPSRRVLLVAAGTVTALAAAAIGTASAATTPPALAVAFPTAAGAQTVTSTVMVTGVLDGAMKRYTAVGLGSGNQGESQKPVFELAPGATLKNVIIGAPGADGVHCEATCNLSNVWWEDVGEDAATLLGTAPAGSVMTVDGGGAKLAADKVFQHNGPGTFVIKNFFVDDFGKLYRSCGNCRHGYQDKRNVVISNVIAQTGHSTLVGINSNYGDTAQISKVTIVDDPKHKLSICERFIGNNTGKEPTKAGTGPGNGCNYTASDITYGMSGGTPVPTPTTSKSPKPATSTSPTASPSPTTSTSPSQPGTTSGGPAPSGLVGFATVNGSTTGGAGGPTVTVTSLAALTAEAAKAGPETIKVNGLFTGAGNVPVTSNKTIVGVGAHSGLTGIGLSMSNVSNVIVQNLNISLVTAASGTGDAIHIEHSDHLWIDHNDLSSETSHGKDYYDGLLDITHAGDYVTVSWNHFHDHWKASLVGHSDTNGAQDTGHLHVTYHHNFFENINSRMPSLRFGTGHVFDNYFLNGSTGAHSREGAQMLVQNNVFRNVSTPILSTGDSKVDGFVNESGNDLGTGTNKISQTGTFTKPPYAFTLDPTTSVIATVSAGAGTGKI